MKKCKKINMIRIEKIVYSIITICILFTFIFPSICAIDYYADINIDVTNTGFVTITGTTNYPDILEIDSQNYTSKMQSKWLLNITKDEIFSEFVFKVSLPPSSSIFNVSSSGTIWIEEESNRLVVHGFGENEKLFLKIYYQITPSPNSDEDSTFISYVNIIFIVVIIIILILIFLSVYQIPLKKQKTGTTSINIMKGLTERQQKIMKLLIESDIPMTQRTIEKELQLPKAAVSRNVHSLEQKGLIEIEKVGISHFIRVKKS